MCMYILLVLPVSSGSVMVAGLMCVGVGVGVGVGVCVGVDVHLTLGGNMIHSFSSHDLRV